MTKQKTIAEWTGYADDEEIKDYRDNYNEFRGDDEEITLEKAASMINEDGDYWRIQWESFTEYLGELMGNRVYWRDDAEGMGWQSRTGYKVFKAENGQEFVDAITPSTSEFSLRVFKHYKGFKVRIGHHDAPMGERHVIRSITEKEYNDNQ